MYKTIKSFLIIVVLTIHIFAQAAPIVLAEESISTPEQTTTEQTTTPEEAQTSQEPTTQETTQSQPTPTPYVEDETDRAARLYREQLQREINQEVDNYLLSQGITPPERNAPVTSDTSSTASQASADSGVGDTEINTGDAATTGTATNLGNNNLSVNPTGSEQGASIINEMNGVDSSNTGSATIDNTDTTLQSNSATVNTDLSLATVTGENSASNNVGDSSITTGDANTSGTVLTMVNTNAAGIMVSEFNVVDDQVGDLVLDFAANCVIGCGGPTEVTNTGNGSGSTNTGSVDTTNSTITAQENDAFIGNDLILSADSGNNTASANTGGDSSITTGDANVAANVLTFANNNIAGNVIYGIVNIFGDLIGDIIFPEDQLTSCCAGSLSATNTGNGTNSTNSSDIDVDNSDTTFQANDADITNNITFDAETGDNSASRNTGGDSSIETGDLSIDANVLNIANSNLIGGDWWLVLVNEAGNWVGKILGAPAGSIFAGSEGSNFQVDENGYITVSNTANGTGSTNNGSVTETNNNVTVQTNDATIENNLNLSANTGGNQTNDNTGGNSSIKTGDANIIANLVNFVNNNIAGNGKLFVTVVNVFGSWMGDFVGPGQHQEEDNHTQDNAIAIGGSNSSNTNNNNNQQTVTPPPSGTQQTVSSDPQDTIVLAIATSNLGFSAGGTQSQSNSQLLAAADTDLVKTAGISDLKDTKKVLKLNLAWGVLFIPAGIILLRRKMKKAAALN